ncbi:Crp/Fnr family transcriptional regulator [Dyadobacter sp. CY261]|uniref:Crp/Fnr family transcriptional regulator n=1 Tax=Dyadobacter sp. CY261 TaxID=2907203 RepID=UPI001F18A697|nr:Crp/Fnr family transcriptional regulator [Dyadobacter sp. CY261]MCF0069590.1 Crp/Fnr family transcriptional regulator [Dyadobacter sp. CY261]
MINLGERLGLEKTRLDEFLEISQRRLCRRGDILFQRNRVCNQLGYIAEGALRTYCVMESGEEISFLLQVNGDFFGDYESYLTGERSGFIVEAMMDTEVLLFDKRDLEHLIDSDVFWLRFSRTIPDVCFLEAKRRIEDLLFFGPEERYFRLLNKMPEIVQKIPLKYISSYLGITPQSLSRIRKRITN